MFRAARLPSDVALRALQDDPRGPSPLWTTGALGVACEYTIIMWQHVIRVRLFKNKRNGHILPGCKDACRLYLGIEYDVVQGSASWRIANIWSFYLKLRTSPHCVLPLNVNSSQYIVGYMFVLSFMTVTLVMLLS